MVNCSVFNLVVKDVVTSYTWLHKVQFTTLPASISYAIGADYQNTNFDPLNSTGYPFAVTTALQTAAKADFALGLV